MTIQWFPGHMTKARRLLSENIGVVDLVLELRDARLPVSSANPLIGELVGSKPRLLVLTKADLADPDATARHLRCFGKEGVVAVALDARDRKSVRRLMNSVREAAEPLLPMDRQSNRALRAARIMVAGIPNVGKSTLINALSGRSGARTGALPGLTRAKQWIRLSDGLELLDTPGLLWPRIDDERAAFKLAISGAIGEGGFDSLELAASLLVFLSADYPHILRERYRLEPPWPGTGNELLEWVGAKRGLLQRGAEVDVLRAASVVLAEFRQGKMGRITLDKAAENV